MGAESRIDVTDRLRAEGRWAEASRRKDELVKEFRDGGMKRSEAAEQAWRQLAEEYPPLDGGAEEALALVGTAPLPESWGKLAESAPFGVEVEWVHQNRALVVEERSCGKSHLHWEHAQKPAPSYGAVNLMEFAATNRAGFVGILHKVKPGDEGDEEDVRRERRSVVEINELLNTMRERADEELLDDVPKAAQDRVRSLVADWSRQHGLALPGDATAALEARVASLVQECMAASCKVEAQKEVEAEKTARVGKVLAEIREGDSLNRPSVGS